MQTLTIPETLQKRVDRGRELAQARPDEFINLKYGMWLVPGEDGEYVVDLDEGTCSCPDFENRKRRLGLEDIIPCKHIFAAEIIESKR